MLDPANDENGAMVRLNAVGDSAQQVMDQWSSSTIYANAPFTTGDDTSIGGLDGAQTATGTGVLDDDRFCMERIAYIIRDGKGYFFLLRATGTTAQDAQIGDATFQAFLDGVVWSSRHHHPHISVGARGLRQAPGADADMWVTRRYG
ncbi:hypothetical protein [Actinomyces respiraculi]|uniref:Uncharacterized protein n=1 Tax=Actinomyces respiraculi TaxID=2744574 RepID=A0A7T0PWA9_9ACTO|nr:hypothetical protein [Actinomyces respiraculi]QPL05529.1 hypothetical protein ID810_00570 [Actinomyces respiraculi]